MKLAALLALLALSPQPPECRACDFIKTANYKLVHQVGLEGLHDFMLSQSQWSNMASPDPQSPFVPGHPPLCFFDTHDQSLICPKATPPYEWEDAPELEEWTPGS